MNRRDDPEAATIAMTDENGVEREFVLIASVRDKDANYILVADKGLAEFDEAEAVILKEVAADGQEHVYEIIEDDEAFADAVALFQNSSEDYDLEL